MPAAFPRKTRILVITPYAGRTGSELMISHLIRHADRERFAFALCSLQPGELLAELPADVPGFVAPHRFSLVQKIQYRFGENPIFRYLRSVQRRFKADVWYLNTLVPAFVIPLAKELGVKVVTHLHELPMEFVGIRDTEFQTLLTQSDLLIGCADVVCERLRQAGAKRVERCYELIDHEQIRVDPARMGELHTALGIQPGEFVWAMAGQSTYRKGFDLLPELAEGLRGQAARLLGLSPTQTFVRIRLPIAASAMRPAIVNEAIMIMKASSLVSVVGILELTRASQALASSTFRPLESYALCGVLYLVINFALMAAGWSRTRAA